MQLTQPGVASCMMQKKNPSKPMFILGKRLLLLFFLFFFLLSLSLSFASFLLLVLFLPPFSLSFSFLSAPECLQLSCVAAKLYRSQASS